MMTTRRRSPSTASKEDHDLKRPRLVEGGGQNLPIEILSPARSTAAWALTSLVGGLSHGNRINAGMEVDENNETPPGAPSSAWGNTGGRRSTNRKPALAQEATPTAAPYSVESSAGSRLSLSRDSARDMSVEKRRGSSVGSSVGDYSRREKSLGLLCVNFMHLYSGASGNTAMPDSAEVVEGNRVGGEGGDENSDFPPEASLRLDPTTTATTASAQIGGHLSPTANNSSASNAAGRVVLSLDKAADELKVERRRIYDIVNILEALDFVTRQRKNTYTWNGGCGLRATLRRLQAEAMQLWPDDANANGLAAATSNSSMGSGTSGSNASATTAIASNSGTSSGARSGRKGRPSSRAGSPPPPTSSLADGPASMSASSGSSGAGGCDGNGKGSRSSVGGGGDRKGKSLGFLCARFVQLFLVGHSVVGLGDARERIFGESPSSAKGDEATEARENKTKVRRLYDIANVLAALGLIVKDPCSASAERRPCFRWVSASPHTILASHGCDPVEDAEASAVLFAMVSPPNDSFDCEPPSSGSSSSISISTKTSSRSSSTSGGSCRKGGRNSVGAASSTLNSHNSMAPPSSVESSTSLSTPPRFRALQQPTGSSTTAAAVTSASTVSNASTTSSYMSNVGTATGCDAETEAAVSTMSLLCQASPMVEPFPRPTGAAAAASDRMRGPGATAAGATSTNLAGGSSSISNGSGASWAAWFDPWAGSLPLDPDAMLSHQVERLRTFMEQYQDQWDAHVNYSHSATTTAFNDDLNAVATSNKNYQSNNDDNTSDNSYNDNNLSSNDASYSSSSSSGTNAGGTCGNEGSRTWVEGEAVAAAAALALSPGAARRQEASARKKERDAQREAEGAMRGLAAVSAALSSCEAEEAAAAAAAPGSGAGVASGSSASSSSSFSSSSSVVHGLTGRRSANAPLAGAFSPSPVLAPQRGNNSTDSNNSKDKSSGNNGGDNGGSGALASASNISPTSANAANMSPQSRMSGAEVAAMMLAEATPPAASTAQGKQSQKNSGGNTIMDVAL